MAEVIIALIGIVSGGTALKLLQFMFGKDKSYRAELRKDLVEAKTEFKTEAKELNDRIDALELDNDLWKAKYFSLVFEIKAYRLKVYQIALEHDVPNELLSKLSHDEDLDALLDELKRA